MARTRRDKRLNYQPKTSLEISRLVDNVRQRLGFRGERAIDLGAKLNALQREFHIRVRTFRSGRFPRLKIKAWANCRSRIINIDEQLLNALKSGSPFAREIFAHELGHIICEHPTSHFWHYSSGERVLENEADLFMRRFLAPLNLVRGLQQSEIPRRFLMTARTAQKVLEDARNENRLHAKLPQIVHKNNDHEDIPLATLIEKGLPFVFVSMSFNKTRKGFYRDTLRVAVREAGLHCCRIDDAITVGSIPDHIQHAINSCAVMLADVSEGNLNVMHEVGGAQALLKPLLLVCDRTMDHTVPFNIRHLRRILYDDHGPGRYVLRQELVRAIKVLTKSLPKS